MTKGKSMKTVPLYASILLISSTMLISACSSSSKKEEPPAPAATEAPATAPAAAAPAATASGSTATAGQKLIDLNQAREAGAITAEEYEAAKKKILDSQ
jgi:hypothetical protein